MIFLLYMYVWQFDGFKLLSKIFLGNEVILMNIEIYSKFYTDLYIMSSRNLRRKFELDD